MSEAYSVEIGSEQMEMMYPDLKAKSSSRTQRWSSANIHKNEQFMGGNDNALGEAY